ncbi:MAG: Repressor in ring oxydation complex/ phenylacetic acid degradation pathway related protein (PaaX) [Microgenomates group bacterium GW2011_GWA1_Microgenomates_45_10]|nr:MAG: Repressor in ring oxydation complex/ phenylacetic acid degradation pathway related protein (PaaX) [Microgenomates group bacterium GW2011_GWA1_Microgenomates_45_10]
MIGDVGGFVLPLFKMAPYRWLHGERPIKDLDEYFPSVVKQAADQLERRGLVKIEKNETGWVVKIADKGRTQILKYKLEEMKPKVGKWDGKWRLVFFDVAEPDKRKRDLLRMYLMKLGMKRMQESVFVSPFDVADEIKYLREVLEIPHGVKMGVLEWIENADKLKEIFDL